MSGLLTTIALVVWSVAVIALAWGISSRTGVGIATPRYTTITRALLFIPFLSGVGVLNSVAFSAHHLSAKHLTLLVMALGVSGAVVGMLYPKGDKSNTPPTA